MCTDYYTYSELTGMSVDKIIPLDNEYQGPRTGKPEKCLTPSLENGSYLQQEMRPLIIGYTNPPRIRDNGMEDLLTKGPIITMISLNKRLLQLYSSGVVTDE